MYLWIHLANPWIRIVSWSQIWAQKRFDPWPYKTYPDLVCIVDHKTGLKKIRFKSCIMNPANFQKIQPVFMNQTNPHESLVLRCSMNKSVSCSKGLFCRFILSYCVLKICFVDSIWAPVLKLPVSWIHFRKNPKMLDLYWFGRIHPQIPQAYVKIIFDLLYTFECVFN